MSVLIVSANHSFRNNAEYHPFQFHPVLGFIEAVVAVKDITKGSEVKVMNWSHCINILMLKVFCNYGYGPDAYNATGIFPQDLECSLVSVKSSFIIIKLIINVLGILLRSYKHDQKCNAEKAKYKQ